MPRRSRPVVLLWLCLALVAFLIPLLVPTFTGVVAQVRAVVPVDTYPTLPNIDPYVGIKIVAGVTSATARLNEIVDLDLYLQCGYGEPEACAPIGIDAELAFDPASLQLVDAAGRPATQVDLFPGYTGLQVIWRNTADNATGRISLNAMRSPVSLLGFQVATLRFKTLAPVASTTIRFTKAIVLQTGNPYFANETLLVPGHVTILSVTSTPTVTPSITPLPTSTPSATPTLGLPMVYGHVEADGAPIAGATMRLLRQSAGGWEQQRESLTGADGGFRWWISPVPGTYRVTMSPPAGWLPDSAAPPAGLTGTVVDASTCEFVLPMNSHVGPFVFDLSRQFTATLTPESTATPEQTIPPPPISLQGYVWADANGDGVRQEGEGYVGVEITISGLGLTRTTTSGVGGYYAIRGLPEGNYTVTTRDPLGRLPETTHPVVVGDDPLKPAVEDWRWWRVFVAWAH